MSALPQDPPVFADYFDGETALAQRTRLAMDSTGRTLEIHLPDEGAPLHWPVSTLRYLPDQADKNALILAQAGAHPARLVVRDARARDLLRAMCHKLSARDTIGQVWRRLVLVAVGAVASVLLIVFFLVPMLANQLAVLLPPEGEQALGDATYRQIRQALGHQNGPGIKECHTTRGDSALLHMMWRLQRGHAGQFKIRLHVLDHGMVNAFALPGGHIVLFRGLLEQAKSPDEVAGVIAHEMGHVAHRDPARLALRSAGSVGVLGLLLGDFAGGAAVLYLSEQLISANYSRAAEAAADSYAANLLRDQRIPSAPLADFFLRLQENTGPVTGLQSHLASHPGLTGRAKKMRQANSVAPGFWPLMGPGEWHSVKTICR